MRIVSTLLSHFLWRVHRAGITTGSQREHPSLKTAESGSAQPACESLESSTIAEVPPLRLRCPPAVNQAEHFLPWLISAHGGTRVLARDLRENIYPVFCRQLNWRPRPWREVAKHLKKVTGGRRYQWVDVDGEKHRWRAYLVPPKSYYS